MHFETMGNPLLVGICRGIIRNQGFLGGAGVCPSTAFPKERLAADGATCRPSLAASPGFHRACFIPNPGEVHPLGPPVESDLFSVVYFSRGTLPQKRVNGHYWET